MESMEALQCFCCDQPNPAGARYCNDCGTPLHLKPCKQCDAINDRPAMHCHQCGAEFAFPFAEPTFEAPFAAAADFVPADRSPSASGITTPRAASTIGANRIPGVALMAGLVAAVALSAYYAYRPPLHRVGASSLAGEGVVGMTRPGGAPAAVASKPEVATDSNLLARPQAANSAALPGLPQSEFAVPPAGKDAATLAQAGEVSKPATRDASRPSRPASSLPKHARSATPTVAKARPPARTRAPSSMLAERSPAPSALLIETDSMLAQAHAQSPDVSVGPTPPPAPARPREASPRTVAATAQDHLCQEGVEPRPACAIRTLQKGN